MFSSWPLWLKRSLLTKSLAFKARRRNRRAKDAKRPSLCLECLEDRSLPSTYFVTNTADSGAGSLRAALSSGASVIDFNIPKTDPGFNSTTGVFTIAPASALPPISLAPVIIDGTSEPGYTTAGYPIIQISGNNAGAGVDGLDVSVNQVTITGLAINQFGGSGISLSGQGNDVIVGDFLGTDATGTAALPNGNGISISSSGNTIGGSVSGNLISGNALAGVLVAGSSTTGNTIEGNLIGVNAADSAVLPNGIDIQVSGGAAGNTVAGNTQQAENEVPGSKTPSAGTWTELSNSTYGGGTMLLLSNGTIMEQGQNGPATWAKLTPDSSGNYLTGTWSPLASMHTPRDAYGSVVLPNGEVMVFGGEYTYSNTADYVNSGEIYNPTTNTWSVIASIPPSIDPNNDFGDDPLETLPNGTVLGGNIDYAQSYIYTPSTNTWAAGPNKIDPGVSGIPESSDEESWVKIPGTAGNILDYELWASLDQSPGYAEYYNTSTNTWVATGSVPVPLSTDNESELGPAIQLPNGNVLQIGANGSFGSTSTNTAIYHPSTNTWTAGPVIPGTYTADDAPAAILPDGNVIFAADSSIDSSDPSLQYLPPTALFEYNPTANTITQMSLPSALSSDLSNLSSYQTIMLVLPNGQLAYADGMGNLFFYSESGVVNSSWQPTISSITPVSGNKYLLTGTQLNGLSEGASFGDDAQMAENYPLVQLTNSSGKVFYATTSNWSSTAVATGSESVSTQFTVPSGLPVGAYTLNVIADGIASAPYSFSFGSNIIVSAQPTGQAGNVGASATFTAAATGTPTPTVQWQVSTDGGATFNPIAGATSVTLSLSNITASQNGDEYEAVFTNTTGSAFSQAAVLNVNSAPTMTTQPADQTVAEQSNATFMAAAGGYPAATVQWEVSTNGGVSFSNISGATSATLTLNGVSSSESGNQYEAVFTNSFGSITSTAATLTVTDIAPVVTSQPASDTVTAGNTATFTAAASGLPAPNVQWEVSTNGGVSFSTISNGSVYGGVTTDTLSVVSTGLDGDEYEAVFTNPAGSAASNAATLWLTNYPKVTIQPVSVTTAAGTTVTLSTSGTGASPLTLQWRVSTNGGASFTNISGATTATLKLTNVSLAMSGNLYDVIYTDGLGSVTSNTATLTVTEAPAVTAQPTNQTVNAGSTATFTAGATGAPFPTVQWEYSANNGARFSAIAGATSPTLTLTNVTALQSGYEYEAVFTNSTGSVTTSAAKLTVNTAQPVVTTQPANQTVAAGSAVSFTAAANGFPPPSVQWYVNTQDGTGFNPITGATSTTLVLNNATASQNGYQYEAVFSNGVGGNATTNAAQLTVDFAPIVMTQPANQTTNAGGTAVFTAAASGNPAPTVRWQVNTGGGFTNLLDGGVYSGSATSTLTITGATAAMSGYSYQAVFTSVAGTTTANAVTLAVDSITTQPSNQSVNSGQTATFSAAASNPSGTDKVQWQVSTGSGFTNLSDGGVYIGSATGTLKITGAAAAMSGYRYQAIITNAAGALTTSAATLTVDSITTQPSNQTVNSGQTAKFIAFTSNPTSLDTVRWQVNTGSGFMNLSDGGVYSGSTTTTLTITGATSTMSGYQYDAVFMNSAGSLTTNSATLTVSAAPALAGLPVVNGSSAVINIVSATGNGTTATITTDGTPHGFWVGELVTLAGVTPGGPGGLAGTVRVTGVPSATTFQFASTYSVSEALSGATVTAALAGAQRSMVDSIVYNFTAPVNLTAAAFSIGVVVNNTSTGSEVGVQPTLNVAAVPFTNEWVVTFTDPVNNSVVGNSIANGAYSISINPALVTAVSGGGNLVAGETDTFYRLYGDLTGAQSVKNVDANAFNRAWGNNAYQAGYAAALDYNDDGKYTNVDANAFNRAFNTRFSVVTTI